MFVQFICGDARKKVFVHKKVQGEKLLWWRVRLGCPGGEVNFFNIFCKTIDQLLHYTHASEQERDKNPQGRRGTHAAPAK